MMTSILTSPLGAAGLLVPVLVVLPLVVNPVNNWVNLVNNWVKVQLEQVHLHGWKLPYSSGQALAPAAAAAVRQLWLERLQG
jgi:hypothetical protein